MVKSRYPDKPLDPQGLKTYAIRSRKSIVRVESFGRPFCPGGSFGNFLDGLPDFLAARDIKDLLKKLRQARKAKKGIIFALGGHVIKVGLAPVLIDLMKEGWISALALNGAVLIHDFEVAFSGRTSEDVGIHIRDGRFGMARETGEILNMAIRSGASDRLGLGESVARVIANSDFSHKDMSLLAQSYRLRVPVTAHVAVGTDTIHFHPDVDGEALGGTSLKDFFLFCSLLRKVEGGGVYINIGSAVVLPEVFLKAVTFLRNKGFRLENFTTAVFDFIHHYRPEQNIVRRPLGAKGKGFYFIGHHEIMIPLLAAGLKNRPR